MNRATIRIVGDDGLQMKDGFEVTRHFGATESPDGWNLTHLKTGYTVTSIVPRIFRSTLEEITVAAEVLERFTVWDSTSPRTVVDLASRHMSSMRKALIVARP